MGIADHMIPEALLLGLHSASRDELFATMADSLAAAGVMDMGSRDALVEKLKERESLSTTGIGDGIAIPHASLDSIEETVIALGVAPDGIDFGALDGKKADVIFMIVGAQRVPRQHLQMLAKIVRVCKDKELMKSIRSETDPKNLLSLLRMQEG